MSCHYIIGIIGVQPGTEAINGLCSQVNVQMTTILSMKIKGEPWRLWIKAEMFQLEPKIQLPFNI